MRVWLRTFGCRANHYDTEAVRGMIEVAGHEIVDDPACADLAVFNSCAVTGEAQADLRQAVRRAARANPRLSSAVMGCVGALDDPAASASLRTLPTVDRVIAGADLPAIAELLALDAVPAGVRTRHQGTTRAVLRVQDGCDERCTFCATRLARGANRSRAIPELIAEAQALAEHHPEIVITGIHIGTYGHEAGSSLGVLLAALVHAVPRVRFRLSSIEATEIDDRLAEYLTGDPTRVAPYLHAPLQSGSNRVLRRMGRHWYTAERYAAAIERLVAGGTPFGVGADVIAGFPGETDADHAATCALIERLPFTGLHVFPYSSRPGTAAERLAGQVRPAVGARRARELRALGAAKVSAYEARRVDGRCDVIAMGPDRAGQRAGLTEDYLEVAVRDPRIVRGDRFSGILRRRGAALVAEPVHPS